MRFFFFETLLIILLAHILSSCSSTKYIPDGEYLLDKIYINSNQEEYGSIELKPYVKQIPNFKMFGLNKTQLQFYNLSGKDSSKWINRQLKKMGEPPVLFDSTLVERTNKEFKKFFINKGYVNAEVTASIERLNKKVNVTYIVQSNTPYRLNNYSTDIPDSAIHTELMESNVSPYKLPGEPAALRTSLISPNMLFDKNTLDAERSRITELLRNRGYYGFGKDYISYDADSALSSNQVDLKLRLHLYPEILPNGMFAEAPHRRYFINKVFIYMDYIPMAGGLSSYIASDSIQRGNYTIFYKGEKPSIRPAVLIENNFLTPAKPYAQEREEITYSSYAQLRSLNNTNIQFEEVFRNDSTLLNAYIVTMPAKRQAVTYSIEGTNSEGDFGFATALNYNHRNLFRGAESFNFKVRGAYEAISENILKNSYLDLGAEASIRVPKFIFPFLDKSFKRKVRASTEFFGSYNYQTRPEYDRNILSASLRYLWQNRGTNMIQHQFRLLDINYVYLPRIDSTFEANLPKNAIYFSYTNQFIVGMNYTYTHSTFNPLQKQRNVHSFRGSVESAGNLLYAASNLFNAPKDDKGSYQLFNTYYAQYVKGDLDYSKIISIDKQNTIAWHVGGGIGIPYGNSYGADKALPFEKRYYSGGANSVRAWSVRTLGPGSYRELPTTTFYEQSGDIKLDFNIEYRSRFFWKLEAAAFVDAGNIWTIRKYEGQENGEFEFDRFYKEIALGYGLGIRLNFDYFLIRVDGGWKAYDPGKGGKDKWAIFNPNFSDKFAWHFAIGYPF